MSQSIVCGVDGTQESRWAARVAGDFARELDRTLVLVHVAGDQSTFPYSDSRLRELQRRDSVETAMAMLERTGAPVFGVEIETHVVFGDAVDAIIAVALEQDAELLVVGSRGAGPSPARFSAAFPLGWRPSRRALSSSYRRPTRQIDGSRARRTAASSAASMIPLVGSEHCATRRSSQSGWAFGSRPCTSTPTARGRTRRSVRRPGAPPP